MNNTTTYYEIEGEISFIDGILSFLKATRTKLFLAALLCVLIIAFEYLLKKPIKFTSDHEALTEQYDEIKKIHDKFVKVIPVISAANNPFFPERFVKRFYRYEEFLENIVDGLAISANKEAKESIRKLPVILGDVSEKLPSLDDVLKTM